MLIRWWLMNPLQAASLNTTSSGAAAQLEPREINMGPHKGKYVLPWRVVQDKAHEAHWDAIMMCQDVSLDPDEMFAPDEDESRKA